ncbi:MAG: orotidine 5'-phosphate decarboxylase / HUMPS family protein [Christensenellaceae bacterium]
MKIQFAIDGISIGEGIRIVREIYDYVDYIELGDGTISRNSTQCIKTLKDAYPEKKIVADLKIMDGGYSQAKEAFELGADVVTVCAVSDEEVQRGTVRAAKEAGKEAWIDLIGIAPSNYHKYVDAINALDADYVCPHLSGGMFADEPGIHARKDAIKIVSELNFKPKVVLSGGLTPDYLPEIIACNPHHVNLGGVLIKAKDPAAVAKKFYEA